MNKGKPLYKQIAYDIVYKIYLKEIELATLLDSVRELSVKYEVTPKTIQAVTKYLDEIGIISRKAGVGSVITNDYEVVKKAYKQHGLDFTREYLWMMKRLGYEKKDIINLINNCDMID